MATHRFALRNPFARTGLASGVSVDDVINTPVVDVDAGDHPLADLEAQLGALGWEHVSTDPTASLGSDAYPGEGFQIAHLLPVVRSSSPALADAGTVSATADTPTDGVYRIAWYVTLKDAAWHVCDHVSYVVREGGTNTVLSTQSVGGDLPAGITFGVTATANAVDGTLTNSTGSAIYAALSVAAAVEEIT